MWCSVWGHPLVSCTGGRFSTCGSHCEGPPLLCFRTSTGLAVGGALSHEALAVPWCGCGEGHLNCEARAVVLWLRAQVYVIGEYAVKLYLDWSAVDSYALRRLGCEVGQEQGSSSPC